MLISFQYNGGVPTLELVNAENKTIFAGKQTKGKHFFRKYVETVHRENE